MSEWNTDVPPLPPNTWREKESPSQAGGAIDPADTAPPNSPPPPSPSPPPPSPAGSPSWAAGGGGNGSGGGVTGCEEGRCSCHIVCDVEVVALTAGFDLINAEKERNHKVGCTRVGHAPFGRGREVPR